MLLYQLPLGFNELMCLKNFHPRLVTMKKCHLQSYYFRLRARTATQAIFNGFARTLLSIFIHEVGLSMNLLSPRNGCVTAGLSFWRTFILRMLFGCRRPVTSASDCHLLYRSIWYQRGARHLVEGGFPGLLFLIMGIFSNFWRKNPDELSE